MCPHKFVYHNEKLPKKWALLIPPHKNFTVTTHQNNRQNSPRQVINSASWELEFNYICFWESFSLVEHNTCEPAQQHFQIKGFQLSAESWKFLFSGVSFFHREIQTVCKKHTFLTQKIILIKKIASTDFFGPFLQWLHAGFPFQSNSMKPQGSDLMLQSSLSPTDFLITKCTQHSHNGQPLIKHLNRQSKYF